jgi:cytochrome P450
MKEAKKFIQNNWISNIMNYDASSSIDPLFSAVILVAFLTIYHLIQKWNKTSEKNEHRNLPPMVSTGMFETMKACSGSYFPWFLVDQAKSCGSIFRLNLPIPGTPMVVVTTSANLARKFLKDPLTTRPRLIYGGLDDVTGGTKSLFTTEGMCWHSRRKGLAPAFSSKHVKRMNEVAVEKAEAWIKNKLVPMVEKGEAFDVGKEMIGITLDAIAETAFEYTISEDEKTMFLHELELCLRESLINFANPFRRLYGLLLPDRRRAFVGGKRLQAFGLKILLQHRRQVHPMKGTVIDLVANSDAYANDEERAADILVMLIAGHDTTGYTMAWILKELAKNPEEQQRLRDTLRASNFSERSQSEYLRKIVREGIRLHPVSAAGPARRIGRDIVTKEGYLLPKNSIVFNAVLAMMRDEDVYKNADSFDPSRWDNPTKAMNDAFLPFAMGKQDCIGQSLANAELHCILPIILSEFELFVVEEGTADFFLTLKPVNTMLGARRV